MLSEIAIDNPKYFSELVKIANAGLEGKTIKQEEVKTEAKETKKEVKEEKTDLSNLTVAQLREIAKDKNIEGYSTMKKAELISALE